VKIELGEWGKRERGEGWLAVEHVRGALRKRKHKIPKLSTRKNHALDSFPELLDRDRFASSNVAGSLNNNGEDPKGNADKVVQSWKSRGTRGGLKGMSFHSNKRQNNCRFNGATQPQKTKTSGCHRRHTGQHAISQVVGEHAGKKERKSVETGSAG